MHLNLRSAQFQLINLAIEDLDFFIFVVEIVFQFQEIFAKIIELFILSATISQKDVKLLCFEDVVFLKPSVILL